jgi:hypothetical protein
LLKTISDHPTSNSNDLAFKYNINSQDLQKATIGSMELNNIKMLYYLDLYRMIAPRLKNKKNIMPLIAELESIIGDSEFLEELLTKPDGHISEIIWRQINKPLQ